MKFVIGIALVLLITTPLLAKDFTYSACSLDKYTVTLGITLDDDAIVRDTTIPNDIGVVFQHVAATMTATELQSRAGFIAFIANLGDEDKAAITNISGPPKIGVDCTQQVR